ncbi:MAG: glycosyl hydrolase [Kiritimatiellae bacterium]|nr:glycosyl hydrolase [Kiritimatiellia bacterium]
MKTGTSSRFSRDCFRPTQPPAGAIGFPSRAKSLDVRPGFLTPPPGYGEVAFHWWLGDPLTRERLAWQIDRLSGQGVMGLQINYSHSPVGGYSWGLTYPSDPPLFSEKWWGLVQWFAGEARRHGMAVSLSDYTLNWLGQGWYVDEILKENASLHGSLLTTSICDAEGGCPLNWTVPEGAIAVTAFRMAEHRADGESVDLRKAVRENVLTWLPPEGRWRVAAVHTRVIPSSIDPLNPAMGRKIIEKFFQRMEDHLPGEAGRALNFFFSDELGFGLRGWLWHHALPQTFQKRKGYDVIPELPALFMDIGPRTPKIRLDYSDVMVALEEEHYFKPIYEWHQKRGMIYGCDHGGRGYDVVEFGDYFRTQRWNQGPGCDQPGLGADVVKNKVASSIAHLYLRPRVWLEGYYGSGWGTTPAEVTRATFRNFLMGQNLLTLHGLSYSMHGGWWEWAPPDNHFNMPYWTHMGGAMKCFERLSYLLSQGHHCCDVAVVYPVASMEAGMEGERSVETAFEVGRLLYAAGVDFDFMDFESLERAAASDGHLRVSGEDYRVLVLPAMRALRQSTLDQAVEFYRKGGIVIAIGALPEASDRTGRSDPGLDRQVADLFGLPAARAHSLQEPHVRRSPEGGMAVVAPASAHAVSLIREAFTPDVRASGDHPDACFLHRRIGRRDVYALYGFPRNTECFFRAHGKAERWDPWTGSTQPLHAFTRSSKGTMVVLPGEASEIQVIVFSPGAPALAVEESGLEELSAAVMRRNRVHVEGYSLTGGPKTARVRAGDRLVTLRGQAEDPTVIPLDGPWDFELKPVLDNRWGDFSQPPEPTLIGPEARQFRYADETLPNPGWEKADLDDSAWPWVTNTVGPRFWKLGPLPNQADALLLDPKSVDPTKPILVHGKVLAWQPMSFSMRWGVEDDPGPQGYHGLKAIVSDDFITLGRKEGGGPGVAKGFHYAAEPEGCVYYLWTTAWAPRDGMARILMGELKPVAIYLNGRAVNPDERVSLKAGANPLLVRFESTGRTHIVFRLEGQAAGDPGIPLAMRWLNDPSVIPFDVAPERPNPAGWYRFTAPPGLKALTLSARGSVEAWVNGRPCRVRRQAILVRTDMQSSSWRLEVSEPTAAPAIVALRIVQDRGCYCGASIPEPIRLDCGTGRLPAGNWAETGVLKTYSGGAWYRRSFELTDAQATGRVVLDLGAVAASAEVHVNGRQVRALCAPPWKVDLSGYVQPGANRLEIMVCNTLANHFVTIPTLYHGDTTSGLLGPVSLILSRPVKLT